MKLLAASSLIAAALFSASSVLAEEKPAAPEPVKTAAPAPHKPQIAPPSLGQFISLVRYADANGDMIIDDQEAEAAIKVLSDCMREQFKLRNQATLKMYDLDQDGRLSAEELLKAKEQLQKNAARARRPVTRPQANGMVPYNGKLSPRLMPPATGVGPLKTGTVAETKPEPAAASPAK